MNLQNINFPALYQALLQDPQAVDFVVKHISNNYSQHFEGHNQEAVEIVEKIFSSLVESQKKGADWENLKETVEQIIASIVKKDDSTFWYNQMYGYYKATIKPKAEYDRIQNWIKGKKVLDFGVGRGYLAQLLLESGFDVIGTDVEDFRSPNLQELPFIKMPSPAFIPLPSKSIETALVITVLHHVDSVFLSLILKELVRVTDRVIVVEDVSPVGLKLEDLPASVQAQPQTKKLMQLSDQVKVNINVLIDFYGNAVSQGLTSMNLPFGFYSIPGWKDVFNQHGFAVTEVVPLGFSSKHLHGFFQTLFVCDRNS